MQFQANQREIERNRGREKDKEKELSSKIERGMKVMF